MAEDQPSGVAEINAQMRAADAKLRPERRLVDDQYARHFVQNPSYKVLSLTPTVALTGLLGFDKMYGGLLAEILLRGRLFETVLADRYTAGVRQSVLIGAGYDTTAIRHPELAGMCYYELDRAPTQTRKRKILSELDVDTSAIRYVAADLEVDTVTQALARTDFDQSKPCVMSWLGVTYYLTGDSFRRALADIAVLCAPGSTLVFDYMDSTVIDGTTTSDSAKRAFDSVLKRGEPYTLGFTVDSVEKAAVEAGFTVTDSLRVPDLLNRYGGADPYCCGEDYMGVLTVTRT